MSLFENKRWRALLHTVIAKQKAKREQTSHPFREFVLMSLSKNKRWRALLHTVIAKQKAKREQTHPVLCAFMQWKSAKKLESINKQNHYETISKR